MVFLLLIIILESIYPWCAGGGEGVSRRECAVCGAQLVREDITGAKLDTLRLITLSLCVSIAVGEGPGPFYISPLYRILPYDTVVKENRICIPSIFNECIYSLVMHYV